MSKQGDASLERTPLFELHRELGAKMVPFAGYQMPLSYPAGILAEHRHTRAAARRWRRGWRGCPSCRAAASRVERRASSGLQRIRGGTV